MIWAMSGMLCVLGFLFAVSWKTQSERNDRYAGLDADQAGRLRSGTIDMMDAFLKSQKEVQRLRSQLTIFQNSVAQTEQGKLLNQSLQEAKQFAGLTPIEGPGIVVTLRDFTNATADVPDQAATIHDTDVLRVVNELWIAGAEAISVNNQRVIGSTGFRCVGPVLQVNGVPLASPITIRAVGDGDTLLGALNIPGGIITELRETSPKMVSMEPAKKLSIPAFSGPTKPSASMIKVTK